MSRHRRCYPHDQDDGGELYGRCLQTVKYDKTEQDEKQSSRVAERGCGYTPSISQMRKNTPTAIEIPARITGIYAAFICNPPCAHAL